MGDIDRRSRYVDYGRVAAEYRRGRALPAAALDRWQAAVRPHLPVPPVPVSSLSVLDVGAGTGMFATAWLRWAPGASVIAVEPSEAMIRAGDDGVRYVQAVAEQLPLADECADVVWISTAVHHFTDLPRAVAECARVLRADGSAMIRTFLPERTEISWMGVFPERARALARFPRLDLLAEVFDDHGLVPVQVGEVPENVWTFGESADWIERMRHADTMLTALTDPEIEAGVRRLRAEPARLARNELSLVVFRRR